MGNRGDVLDQGHFQASGLQRTDGGFTTGTGALDKNFHGLQTMFHCGLCGGLGSSLCCEGGGLLRTTEAHFASRCPADGITLSIGNGHHCVVERGTDMHGSLFNIFTVFALAHDSFLVRH